MAFIRNWVLPILSSSLFAFLGFMLIGLPGVNMIQTLDGIPVPDGISPEQFSTILAKGQRVGSYLDVYGVPLPGEPLYWTLAIVGLSAFVGYRLGVKFKMPRTDG